RTHGQVAARARGDELAAGEDLSTVMERQRPGGDRSVAGPATTRSAGRDRGVVQLDRRRRDRDLADVLGERLGRGRAGCCQSNVLFVAYGPAPVPATNAPALNGGGTRDQQLARVHRDVPGDRRRGGDGSAGADRGGVAGELGGTGRRDVDITRSRTRRAD